MTTQPPNDFLDLTAFALGELEASDAARVKQYLASSPAARAEYVRIEHAIAALKRGAVIPTLALNKRQRETVLAVGQTPSRSRVIALPIAHQRRASPVWSFVKLAAAACVAVGAFFLGQRAVPPQRVVATSHDEIAKADTAPSPSPVVTEQPKSEIKQSALVNIPTPEIKSPEVPVPRMQLASNTPAPTPVPAVSPEPVHQSGLNPIVVKASPRPAAAPAAPLKGFNIVATQPEASILFHPKLVKSVPQVFADKVIFAAPMPLNARPAAPEPHHKTESLPLVIHSSRAEIASCPWNSSNRLMRLVVQVPVDQPAVENADTDYKLIARFDPFQVQGYRLVAEKHLAPSNGSALATRFAWYEIVPTKNFAPTHEKPVNLGTFEVAQPKAGRDSSPLRLVDRGLAWNESREDFVFETAMIGFSMLLKGTENVGQLDHRLVLDIAEKSKGEDPKGERAKFIKAVQQARKAAGL